MHLLFERNNVIDGLRHRAPSWREISKLVAVWWAERRLMSARRRSLVQLADMEEWQLRDIGVTRSEVDHHLKRNGIVRDLAQPIQPH